uniref:RAD50-interacting protein 1 n=1 Tax=Anthurium amnicola TaxID=1678845 RepID=A0A1D1XRZ7_9ARAE
MEDIEKILVTIASDHLPWTHLLVAVDSRVEKTLNVLRPQALTDHRSILASIRWPPPPSTSILENGRCSELPNPLVLMEEDKKERYSKSFLALLALQVLQAKRERRKLSLLIHQKGQSSPGFTELGNELRLLSSIWTVDELVYLIAPRVEHHFSKWFDQPELIFALTYRITRDLLEGIDKVLQPLIDKAQLLGFSAREAWISAMIKMLVAYLEKRVFPDLCRRYGSESMDAKMISSWLHLIDLIITFDKKMRALASSGILIPSHFTEFDGVSASQPLSILSLFCDHPEWVELWAQMELKHLQDKLKGKLDDDGAWTINIKQVAEFIDDRNADSFTFSSMEHYKAPRIADSVIKMAWTMIERGWALPSMPLKIKFVRSSTSIFLHHFSNILLQHSQEFETINIMEDDVIHGEASSINAARYCESVMREWSENLNFLEMSMVENNEKKLSVPFSCFFADEITIFSKLETDCIVEIMSALLLEFGSRCYDYVQSKERWGEDLDELTVYGVLDKQISAELVEALHMLRDRLQILKMHLNFKDFLDLWRSVAGGLDHFIFRSILLSNARFSDGGILQFKTDLQALFLVFKPFCIRPEAFFPCISDSLKLFAMCQEDVNHLIVALKGGKRDLECLHLRGLFHLSLDQAERILSNKK